MRRCQPSRVRCKHKPNGAVAHSCPTAFEANSLAVARLACMATGGVAREIGFRVVYAANAATISCSRPVAVTLPFRWHHPPRQIRPVRRPGRAHPCVCPCCNPSAGLRKTHSIGDSNSGAVTSWRTPCDFVSSKTFPLSAQRCRELMSSLVHIGRTLQVTWAGEQAD